jgi:parallel beta-helix repeat protein
MPLRVSAAVALLTDSSDNEFVDNNFSHCSNVCARLWRSCRNRFLNNNLSYGLRIDVSKGEKHARDSTGILLEDASHDNYWYRNDITHGGDGIFIRALRTAKSTGNVFIENDTSYANNNCVESWCPNNTFIRNKANHGSYGFWLGGSDNSVLIGNEAGFNGQPDGFHNAPLPLIRFAGIIFAGGSGNNCVVEGNYVHDNFGAGIALQGDVRSMGKKWKSYHWIIQNNRLENNRQGIYTENADWIFVGPNTYKGNAKPDSVKNVTRLINGTPDPSITRAPVAILKAPERAKVGESITLDASESYDPQEKPLTFQWDVDGAPTEGATVTRTFDKPGTYRIAITVSNGTLAGLANKDIVVE